LAEMNKIGVIGANGYIGRHVAKGLFQKGYEVLLCDIQRHSVDGHKNYFQLDLRQFETLPEQLRDADFIFYFAGLTGTSIGLETNRDFIEVNEIGLLNFFEFYREERFRAKIIFPSSRLVYKGQKDTPLKEDDEKEFKTVYAMTKFASEQYFKLYHRLFGIAYTIFRICVPYGNNIDSTMSYGTLNHFLSKATKGEPLTIYGDGDQKRSFIHIQDLTSIFILGGLDSRTDNNEFNISGPDILSIREVAGKIAKQYGVSVTSVPWPEMARMIESGDTIFDSSKLEEILNYQYQYDFDTWLSNLAKE
jgi:UDP-glucose 4-epimerase